MPIPINRDFKQTLNALTPWFKDKLSCKELKLESLGGPETTGFSNETLTIKNTFKKEKSAIDEFYVLRLKPTEFQVFPEYDLTKQVKIMKALRNVSLPTPEVLWEEKEESIIGTPFYVMRWIEGEAPADNPPFHMDTNNWVAKASPKQRKELWYGWVDYMSKVHLLNPHDLDLLFLDQPHLGKTSLDQSLSYYEDFLKWSMEDKSHELCEIVLEWLKDNRPQDNELITLCWGDCRCGNILYSNFKPTALLDWEMASLGNPLMDLAWGIAVDDANSLGLNVHRLEGFPDSQQTIDRWIKNTGFSADNYSYYRILALFKFSVIMVMTSKKMIYTGFLDEDSDYFIDNHVTQYLKSEMEKI